jgi:methylmalonyl-CoA mutase cobalamin-binding domain/chain
VSEENAGNLSAAVLAGEAEHARELTERALAAGMQPEDLLAQELIPAMDVAGTRFETSEFFLPDLLLAARAMQESLALLTPLLAARDVPPVGRVVIGTAAGDLHDIGKNIVAAVLEGGGFIVHDLGYDVSPEAFARAAREHEADIVAVSALLTTTMPRMEEVLAALEREGVRDRVKVLVGGAPLSDAFAAKIGADGYGPTAAAAVRLAKALLAGDVRKPSSVALPDDAPATRRTEPGSLDEHVATPTHPRPPDDSVTPRELVRQALGFAGPARLPRQLWLLPWAAKRYPDAVARLERDFPPDIVPIPLFCSEPVPGQGNAHEVGTFVDAWGCTFHNLQEGIIGEVKDPQVRDWSDVDHVRFPRERLTIDRMQVTDFCRGTDRYVLAGTCPRPFERLQFLRGTENLYLDLGRPSSALSDFLQRLHAFYVEELMLWAQTEVDGLTFMDDWGSQQALLISPELWREMFKPLYAEYVDIAHAHGKQAFMHSDGYITDIIPDLIEIGLDALNAQVACMGVPELGRRFGGELTFWGELDRQHVLAYGTPDEVRAATRDLIDAFHHDGGFVAQCEFGPGARPENVYAFFEACGRMA